MGGVNGEVNGNSNGWGKTAKADEKMSKSKC
jgi:hypothetical protein